MINTKFTQIIVNTVECPVCKVKKGEYCKTPSGEPCDDLHKRRYGKAVRIMGSQKIRELIESIYK